MRKLRLISTAPVLFLALLDARNSLANDRIRITAAAEPKILDQVSTMDFSTSSIESFKAILKSKEAVQELVKELRPPQPVPAEVDSGEDRKEIIDRYEILSLTGDGKIQVLVFTYFQSSNPRYDGILGAQESLILTIYKEGGSVKMNQYEDCSAQSSKQVVDDFNHDGRHEILEGCLIFGYRGGGQACNACAHDVVYHILGFQDGTIVHVENEFRDAYSKIVLPILNADLKKNGGRAEKESLGIATDFLSSPVPKGTSSKCPVEEFISKPKRRFAPGKE